MLQGSHIVKKKKKNDQILDWFVAETAAYPLLLVIFPTEGKSISNADFQG